MKTVFSGAVAAALLHSVSAGPVAGRSVALANWEKWSEMTLNAPDAHPKTQPYGTWTPEGFSPDTFKFSFNKHHQACANDAEHDFEAGHIVKTVTNQNENFDVTYKFWYNETYRMEPKSQGSSQCSVQAGRSLQQCENSIWDPDHEQWVALSSASPHLGWTSNNATYGGHTVRTIYDCLLKMVAVEYATEVSDLGAKPVQYYIGSIKYWRYYDNNNFAWFFACPSKKHQKRQGACIPPRCRNTNPVWDFGTASQRDPNSDMTPYPASQIPGFDLQTSYVSVFWPEGEQQFVNVEGDKCMHMAVSRPGLRHWTARMIEIPEETYIAVEDEVNYPAAWTGFSKRSWSWEQGPFVW